MLRSSTSTSGGARARSARASATSPASATTSIPSSPSSSMRRPLRTTAWSSAITILVIGGKLPGRGRGDGGSRHHRDCGKLRTRRRQPPVAGARRPGVASRHDRRRASRAAPRARARGGDGTTRDLSGPAWAGRGPRDAHLVGLPRRRPRVQAQEAGPAAVPRLRNRRAPPRDVRRGDPAQPPARPARVPRRAGRRPGRRAASRSRPRTTRARSTTWSRCAGSTRPARSGHGSPAAACPTRRSSPSAGGSPSSTPTSRRATAPTPPPRSSTRSTRTPRRSSSSRPTRTSRAGPRPSPASRPRSSARAAPSWRPAPPPAASATATATCAPSTSCSSTASRSSTASSSTPRCRVTDVGCDLAFLIMDLEALGSPFAAQTVLAGYRDAGGDPGDDALVNFFATYRALVRAKVALVRAGQAEDRDRRVADARRRLALAERLAWRVRGPGLVVVAGLSATGKTTLADLLAERSGTEPSELRRGAQGTARHRARRTGRRGRLRPELQPPHLRGARRAAHAAALEDAGGVIVDATFRDREDRAAFLDDARRPARRGDRRRMPRARLRPPRAGAPAEPRDVGGLGCRRRRRAPADRRRPSCRRRASCPARRAPHRPAAGGGARRSRRAARRPPRPSASVVRRKRARSRADGRSGRRP